MVISICFNFIYFQKLNLTLDGIIDNEYVLDIILGVRNFYYNYFLILMVNKGISKAVTYSGLGTLDKVFGFFFGF